MTVSAVIPFYNLERYVRPCLDSVVAAFGRAGDGVSLELVCVDDGSTDSTSALLDEYAASVSTAPGLFVRFIHENYTVAGHDVAGEKARYEAEQKRKRKGHWGKVRVEQWINRKLFKTYRRLQDYLIGQKLIPGDRPCWFEESDKVWPHGPVPEQS